MLYALGDIELDDVDYCNLQLLPQLLQLLLPQLLQLLLLMMIMRMLLLMMIMLMLLLLMPLNTLLDAYQLPGATGCVFSFYFKESKFCYSVLSATGTD